MKVVLGTNKEVVITPWKAKNKKQFIKYLTEKGDDMTGEDVANILIRQNIDQPDIYLNPDEAQYLLIKIKEISIGGKVEFNMDCDSEECNESFDVSLNLSDITKYTPSKFPSTDTIVSWREIPSQKVFDDIAKKSDEDYVDIEMMLHIDKLNGVESVSFADTLAKIDNLELKDAKAIEIEYLKVLAYIELGSKIDCPHCGYSDYYDFDIIPHFFDELLPN